MNNGDVKGGSRNKAPSLKRCSRANSHEFETVKPEQKILTPDEKVREVYSKLLKSAFRDF